MAENVTIALDLDSAEFFDALTGVEDGTEKTANKVNNILSKSLSKLTSGKIRVELNNIDASIIKLTSTLALLTGGFLRLLPTVIILEQRFQFISRLLNKVGLDLDFIIDRVNDLRKNLIGLATGEKSVKSLKISFGKLAEEMGIVDSKFLSFLNTVDNTGIKLNRSLSFFQRLREIAIDLSITFAKLAPIIALLEAKFGIFSSIAERFGLNIDDVEESLNNALKVLMQFIEGDKGVLALKIAMGLLGQEIGLMNNVFLKAIKISGDLSGNLRNIFLVTSAVGAFGLAFQPVITNLNEIRKLSTSLFSLLLNPRGLFGIISTFSGLATATFAASESLRIFNNKFTEVAANLLKASSIVFGGIAAAITFSTLKISEFGRKAGSSLVNFFENAAQKFNKVEESIEIFDAALDSVNRTVFNAAGTNEQWSNAITKVSNNFNFLRTEVSKSAQEIALVGSKLSLNREQMLKLLMVSAEYAKINKKDVLQTTVNLINALNGNAQAVAAYGIKLNQASVQQFAYKKGITRSISSLNEAEVVQIRFNKLLQQYSQVAGVGTVAANSLADQNIRLSNNIDKLSASLGKGARLIESNNIISAALNLILNNVNESVLSAIGFFGALGARILQFSSIALGLSLKIFAVIKAFKLLDIILKSEIGKNFFVKTIPFINLSLDQLISRITKSEIKVRSLQSAFKAITKASIVQFSSIVEVLTGKNIKLASATELLTGAISKLRLGFSRLLIVLAPILIPLAKIGIIITSLIGVYKLFEKVITTLNQKTGALSELFSILSEELRESTSVIKPLIEFFKNLQNSVVKFATQGLGLLVFGLQKIISLTAKIASSDPFGVFSEKSKQRLTSLSNRLNEFGNKLKLAAFDISSIPDAAGRSIANTTNQTLVNLDQLAQKINSLRDEFKFFGLTDVEVIRRKESENLEALRLAFENQLILEKEYNILRAQIREDALNRIKEIEKKKAEERLKEQQRISDQLNNIVNNSFANAISGGIQNIVKSLAEGKNVFEEFGSFILNLFGDLAIQLGSFYIAQGIANLKLLTLDPSGTIAAGVSLVALGAILKAFVGGGSSGASNTGGTSGVAPIGAEPAAGELSTPLADPDDIQERTPSTNVNIVVEGSLVRQEELGEYITTTLNESFGKQGVTLTDARIA